MEYINRGGKGERKWEGKEKKTKLQQSHIPAAVMSHGTVPVLFKYASTNGTVFSNANHSQCPCEDPENASRTLFLSSSCSRPPLPTLSAIDEPGICDCVMLDGFTMYPSPSTKSSIRRASSWISPCPSPVSVSWYDWL